jgi:multimeric flavodoxin WrbA
MKILLIDGCAVEQPAAAWLAEACRERGWSPTTLNLRALTIASCTGCFGCWLRTPGICVTDDDGREVLKQLVQSDGVILLTPVTFGGYSALLKRALDRIIPMISPFFSTVNGETHHRLRYTRQPRFGALGLMGDDDAVEAQTFRTLVARNALNWHEPRPAVALVRADAGATATRATLQAAFDIAGWK